MEAILKKKRKPGLIVDLSSVIKKEKNYPLKQFRYLVIERDKKVTLGTKQEYWLCYICNRELTKKQITIDHVTPRSKGGKNQLSNGKVCCGECNSKKGNTI